jgi:hypothetical protein
MSYEADWAALRKKRGACPDPQGLKDFLAGKLAPNEQQRIAAHVELCGLCDLFLSRLTPADVQIPAGRWKRAEAKLQKILAVPSPRGTGIGHFFRHPALGYALALLLCIPAYRGLVERRQPLVVERVSSFPMGITPIRILDFPARTRGVTEEQREIRLGAQDKLLGLSFFIPDRSRLGWHYDAGIMNGAGKEVTQAADVRSQDGMGNFLVVVGTELLPAGRYELRIRETGPASGEATEYQFPFAIRSPTASK